MNQTLPVPKRWTRQEWYGLAELYSQVLQAPDCDGADSWTWESTIQIAIRSDA